MFKNWQCTPIKFLKFLMLPICYSNPSFLMEIVRGFLGTNRPKISLKQKQLKLFFFLKKEKKKKKRKTYGSVRATPIRLAWLTTPTWPNGGGWWPYPLGVARPPSGRLNIYIFLVFLIFLKYFVFKFF